MRILLTSRRGFLAMLVSLLTIVAASLHRYVRGRNPLVGDWKILEYVCDGKRVATETMDVAISITASAVTTRIRMQGHPDHIEVHKYSTRPSIQEIDMDASNGGAFLGVYAQHTDGLILAWDTIGEGRPRNVDDTPRFGLNRMVLMRHDTLTRRTT